MQQNAFVKRCVRESEQFRQNSAHKVGRARNYTGLMGSIRGPVIGVSTIMPTVDVVLFLMMTSMIIERTFDVLI